MAQNQNDNSTLLLLAALGIGGYFVIKKMNQQPTRRNRGEVYVDPVETIPRDSAEARAYQEKVDAVVDSSQSGGSLTEAVEKAKVLADTYEDAKIVVKHGAKKFAIRKGRKKIKPTKKRKVKKLRGKKLKKGIEIAKDVQAATMFI